MTTASISNTQAEPAPVSNSQLRALLETAGVAPLQLGWIRVTGSDRVRWLNGMATNSVQQLAPGQGAYNFFLSSQGRIQGDGYIFASPDALLIETADPAKLIPYLDHYIIMDDVELTDVTATHQGVSIIGPQAAQMLSALGLPAPEELHLAQASWNGTDVTVLRTHSPVTPRFELWVESTDTAASLVSALAEKGAVAVEPSALETLRVLEATPLYGTDIRNSDTARDLPQETSQTRALHFNKGCYLGQEIVERIRSRGNVHRTFTAFTLDGSLPAVGAVLEAAGKPAGELTSIVTVPLDSGSIVQLALGYARREALERQEPITYPGGVAHAIASPVATGIKLPR